MNSLVTDEKAWPLISCKKIYCEPGYSQILKTQVVAFPLRDVGHLVMAGSPEL